MHTQRTGIALVASVMGLLSGALLTGCPVYWGNGEDPCRAGRCACETNDDCVPGEICSAGRCVDRGDACDTTDDCGTREICAAGMCVPQARCRTHGDCPTGAYCANGLCEPSSTCTGDAQCTTEGQWCDFRSTCVPRDPGACRTTADCGDNLLCIENVCTDVGTTCQLDRECPAGSACVNNECTLVCGTDDGVCAAGDTCVAGFCRGTQTCSGTDDCNAGEHCVEARCLPDCAGSGTCSDANAYCADDLFCRPDWQRTPFCSMDSDCNDGRVCRSGVCRTPCPAAPMTCMSIDSQFVACQMEGADMLCVASGDTMVPQCRTAADCSAGRDCVNGQCRAR